MSRAAAPRSFLALLAGAAVAVVTLVGCGSPGEPTDGAPIPTGTTGDAGTSAQQRVPTEGTTGAVTVTATSVVVGNPEAAERVAIYQDLNCPHCQALHGLMAADTSAWAQGSDVAVEHTVVDYLGPRTTHGFSTRGANLLALVADVDPEAWPGVLDALLAMQPTATTQEVTTEELIDAARGAGATLSESDVAAQEQLLYSAWVETTTATAASAGVSYIPQVWIDGELVAGESHEETAELVRLAVAGGA